MIKKVKDTVLGYIDPKTKRINSLENEVYTLESIIKDELYKEFMNKLGEPAEMQRLRKDNKRLRLQVKSLKEVIKNN